MAWETVTAWENRTGQIMTARWLNRVVGNIDWLTSYAVYGASPFRSTRRRAPATWAWGTIWRGVYRHVNTNLQGVYYVWRTTAAYYDDDGGESTHPNVFVDGHIADPSQIIVEIYDDTPGWVTVYSGSHAAEGFQSFDVALSGVAGLNLTPGNIYNVRIQALNGGFELSRLHAAGGAASYAWPTLPTGAVGQVLTYADWNLYRTALLYLAQVFEGPRGPTQGIYRRSGDHAGNSRDPVAWRGKIKHRANTLKYSFSVGDIGGGSGCLAQLYYNGVLIDDVTSTADGSWNTKTASYDLTALGLAIGTWYDVELRLSSADSQDYTGNLDYVFEVDGEPAAAITSLRWAHGDYVQGGSGFGSPALGQWNTDLTALKALADAHVQLLCPDQASLAVALPADGDTPNDLSFIRQRTQLMYGGTNVVVYWGATDAPAQQALGTGYGTVDLRGLSGLDIGVRYWLTPHDAVNYGIEV